MSEGSEQKNNNDKETISRLREALAHMNKDYMQTKLELDQMKGSQSTNSSLSTTINQSSSSSSVQRGDLGAHFLKISSKVKAFQSNINTKLATAGLQINTLKQQSEQQQQQQQQQQQDEIQDNTIITLNNGSNDNNDNNNDNKDKEIRRLKDDIESLELQMKNLKKMLKESMEQKDIINKERNELLIKYGEADEQIKKLKEQSNIDANRYEQLLDSFRAENSTQIENEKKKLYKECDDKITNLNAKCQEYKEKYETLQNKWNQNEEEWNQKFDLIVTERNSLKRKVKSLTNELSDHVNHKNDDNLIKIDETQLIDNYEQQEFKINEKKNKEIERLKNQLSELKKLHNNEKTALLNNIQRLSSKTSINSKGSDMQFLVNSLSSLISEKEEIIQSLTESKKSLGKLYMSALNEIATLKKTK